MKNTNTNILGTHINKLGYELGCVNDLDINKIDSKYLENIIDGINYGTCDIAVKTSKNEKYVVSVYYVDNEVDLMCDTYNDVVGQFSYDETYKHNLDLQFALLK